MYRFFILLALYVPFPVIGASHCVILQYHHISDDTPASTSVSIRQFEDHLEYIQSNGFQVMALRDVVFSLRQRLELPEKCVSLTVDDAYISIYENAYPRLKKLGWPFTVFVNSKAVDDGLYNVMSWSQMREMSLHGVSFENHGHAHLHMIRKKRGESNSAWLQRIELDIRLAQQRIQQETGTDPELFSFAFGEFNPELIALIKGMDLTGFGQQSGPAWPDANFGVLPRFPMAAHFAEMPGFITKLNSLPLPIIQAEPADPVVEPGLSRPSLHLSLAVDSYSKDKLRCFVNGSDQVEMLWSETKKDYVTITPLFDVKPGRHRTNCTMPSDRKDRFHWYSHNWFMRNSDGSWYPED